MHQLSTGEPVWDLEYSEDGALVSPTAGDELLSGIRDRGLRDLFVVSHGWNNSPQVAQSLYDDLFPLVREASSARGTIGPLGFAGVFWPSLWFPPTPATPPPSGGGLQSSGTVSTPLSSGTQEVSGAEIARALSQGFSDPDQRAALADVGRLIDEGQAAVGTGLTEAARLDHVQQIHQRMALLVPPSPPTPEAGDDGERALLYADDPRAAYLATARAFGTVPPGSATQGVGDWFGGALNGAKDALRVLSYTLMKARAGTIGRTALGPLLVRVHRQAPELRVHLVGHSFGARLVSFALAGIPDAGDSPVASLVLLQGAFSHFSFSPMAPFGQPGALAGCSDRVSGPLAATFTEYDWAVGIWYRRASFLARQDQSGEASAGRWGGMGADGFQAVEPLVDLTMRGDGSDDYKLEPGTFHRVDATAVINDVQGQPFSGAHSDIRKAPVADLIAQAAEPRS